MNGFGFSLAGLVVGTAVGATGVGGGSLMTPLLILFYGVSPAVAVGTDLLYASISKSFGVVLHGRRGTVDWRIVAWLAAGSVPAALAALAFLRSQESLQAAAQLINLTLALAVVVTAGFTLLQQHLFRLIRQNDDAPPGFIGRHQRLLTVSSGALIGALVTISSVGAGVIGMVLLFLLYPKHPPLRLVGSDLAHAVLITAIAGLGHAGLGTVDYRMLAYLLLGAVPGIWLGSRVAFGLDERSLKRTISAFLVFIGVTMAAKAMAFGA